MGSQQIEKYKGLREDEIKKLGLKLASKKVHHLNSRQIAATKATPIPPISAFAQEEFVNDTTYKPLKGLKPNYK
jgi:hypothetical protein